MLLVYGYGGYKEQMVGYARMLHAVRLLSFMFDMQGSGVRRGEPISLGYNQRWDLWPLLATSPPAPNVRPDRIGVFGVSMGGATALLAAAEESSIRAIVSDSGYADCLSMVRPGLQAFLGKPAVLFAPLSCGTQRRWQASRPQRSCPRQRSRAWTAGRLRIHGDNDQLVPVSSAYRIFEHASGAQRAMDNLQLPPRGGPERRGRRVQGRV